MSRRASPWNASSRPPPTRCLPKPRRRVSARALDGGTRRAVRFGTNTTQERFMAVHALKTAKVANLRSDVSPEEWQARVDLAACYRLMDVYGMTDLIANHISMRVPGEPDHFLINAYGMLYEEITASSLIKID